jgi:NADH:ubiquinone oxidoreductase subunit E
MENKQSTDNRLGEVLAQFEKDRSSLLPILQKVQEVEKHLSPESISEISRFLGISENYIFSVATFYSRFRFKHPGDHTIRVCTCNACHLMGAEDILDSIEQELNIHPGETTGDGGLSIEETTLSGCSTIAPVVMIDREIHALMTPEKMKELLEKYK